MINWRQRLYLLGRRWWHQWIPAGWRQAAAARGWTTPVNRLGRSQAPETVWPLNGPLQGHRLQIGHPEEFQFVERPYEPQVCAALERLVQPGWVCADVGAHIGYMTLLLAKQVGPAGRVIAFEAVPENARRLAFNMRLNGYGAQVVVENRAVADGSQPTQTLYAGPSSYEATLVTRGWAPLQEVPAVALDDYFPPPSRLDFIKMDIEGAEVGALAGMRRLLAETRPLILIEIHDVGRAAADQLAAAGYRFYDLDGHPQSVAEARALARQYLAMPVERSL